MSKQQVIPEAAVEAAAKEFFGTLAMSRWSLLGPITQDAYRDKARAALEAAAPFMCPPSSQVATQAARLRATLDERLGRGAPHTREGDHE